MAFLPKYTFTSFTIQRKAKGGCNDERGERWRDEKAINGNERRGRGEEGERGEKRSSTETGAARE